MASKNDNIVEADGATLFDEMTSGGDSTALVPSQAAEIEAGRESGPETEVLFSGRAYSAETPSFAADEIGIPRLRLAQGLTAEVQEQRAHSGQWVLTGFEAEDTVRVAPLMFSRARTLRDKELNVLCQSADGKTGTGVPGGSCEQCPKSKWTEAVAGAGKNQPPKNNPPECDLIYSYICYSFTHGTIIAVEFKKTSIAVGKTLNTLIATKGMTNFAVTLGASRQQNTRGSFFVATVTNSPLTDEEHSLVVSVLPEF